MADTYMPGTYATKDDFIHQRLDDALGSGDGVHEDFDVDALFDEVAEWYDAYDADENVYHLNHQGFRFKPEYDPEVSEDALDAFWAVVERLDQEASE